MDEALVSPLEFFTDKPSRKVVRLESVEGTIRAVVPSQLLWLDMGLVMGKDGILKEVGKTEVKRVLTQRTAKRLSLEVEIRPGPSQFFGKQPEAILTGLAVCVGPEGDRKPAVGQQMWNRVMAESGFDTIGSDRRLSKKRINDLNCEWGTILGRLKQI